MQQQLRRDRRRAPQQVGPGDGTRLERWHGRKAAQPSPSGGPVPTIGGCPIFPADNPWNTRIDDTTKFPVHPQWSTYQAKMNLTTHLHPDWGNWSTDHYGIPWQTVPSTQAGVPMTFDYADESDPGPYPFPADAKVEGGAGSGGDMHVLVVEMGACSLYETWSSTYVAPGMELRIGREVRPVVQRAPAGRVDERRRRRAAHPAGPREGLGGAGGRGRTTPSASR